MEDVETIINSLGDKKHIYNLDLVRVFLSPLKLSEEEASKEFTPDELKWLCLNVKCKVDMCKWNPAYDYYEHFTKKGLFDNRSSTTIRHLIAKAVNKYKYRINRVYPAHLIQEWRNEIMLERKQANIRLLKVWTSEQIPYDNETVIECISPAESEVIVIESQSSDGLLTQYLQPSQNGNENEVQYDTINEGTSLASENLAKLNINPELCRILEINTSSMDFNSNSQSEEVTSFDEFTKNIISASTESPPAE